MTKKEYIRQMEDEQLIDTLINSEERILIAACKAKYCPYYVDDKMGGFGSCNAAAKGKTIDEGCSTALKAWLNSEVSDSGEWYE